MRTKQMNDLLERAFKGSKDTPPVVTPGDLLGDGLCPMLDKMLDRIETLEAEIERLREHGYKVEQE